MSHKIYGEVVLAPTTHNFFALGQDLSELEYSGFYTREYCYREIKKYDVVYYDFVNNGWAPARSDSLKYLPAKGIALIDALAHDNVDVLLYGEFYNPNWDFADYINNFIYVDQFTFGAITTVDKIDYIYRYRQPIGLVTKPNQIFFYFYQLWFNNIDEGFS